MWRWICVLGAVTGCGAVKALPDGAIADTGSSDDAAPVEDAMADSQVVNVPASPTMWLALDDNPANGATDSANPARGSTCTACPTLDTGVFGSAYKFATQRIDVGPSPDLDPGTALTIAAWVRIDTAPTGNASVACLATTTSDCSYALLIENAALAPGYYTNSGGHVVSPKMLTLGTWHHLAMTWSGTTVTGYFDGVQDATAQIAGAPATSTMPFMLGGIADSYPLTGAIDQVVYYRRVLTQAEITHLAAR